MKMEASWRFDTPGAMPLEAVRGFETLIDKVVAQGHRWSLLEHFKSHFGGSGTSSSESWAESDLSLLVGQTAENAPLFIEAFYEACEALRADRSIAVPDVGRMNRILKEHGVGYESERRPYPGRDRRPDPRAGPCQSAFWRVPGRRSPFR